MSWIGLFRFDMTTLKKLLCLLIGHRWTDWYNPQHRHSIDVTWQNEYRDCKRCGKKEHRQNCY